MSELEKKLWIKVKTGSKEQSVKKGEQGLEVRLKSQPIKGQANRELMQVLSDFFGVNTSKIRIIKGVKSRNKLVSVSYRK